MRLEDFHERLVEERGHVQRMAQHLAGDPELAADLSQETFARALRAAPRFELREQGMRPWLLTILQNCFYTRVGQRQRQPVAVGELAEHQPADEAAFHDADREIDWEWVDERLKHALDELKPAYRDVLLLSALRGLKYREIAERLGVPIGTVMSRLSRARRVLYRELADYAAEQGIAVDTAAG